MASRDRFQSQHASKLITNVKFLPSWEFEFDINASDELFTFQRNPLYNVIVLDTYTARICLYVYKSLFQRLKKHKTKRNKATRDVKFTPQYSAVQVAFKVYSLHANHPSYGRAKTSYLTNTKSDKFHVKTAIHLYNNNRDLKELCYLESIISIFTKKKHANIQKKRSETKNALSSKSWTQKNFTFAEKPSNVGEVNPNAVFISDLKQLLDVSRNQRTIYCDGFINFENGFDKHPYITGSGDHINISHLAIVCKQFIYLLVRNSKQMQFNQALSSLDVRFIELINKRCSIAIFDTKIQTKHPLELGTFRVKLKSLNMEICNHQTDKNQKDCFICRMKIPYSFNVSLNIQQNNKMCAVATLNCCPIFLSSCL
eukprot:287416_1